MSFVITGSVAYDYLMRYPGRFRDQILPDQLDNISLSFLADSMRRERGGVAANIAYTMKLLGGDRERQRSRVPGHQSISLAYPDPGRGSHLVLGMILSSTCLISARSRTAPSNSPAVRNMPPHGCEYPINDAPTMGGSETSV